MPYSESGETVTLTLPRDDYYKLLFYMGLAASSLAEIYGPESAEVHAHRRVLNDMNIGNPNFEPVKDFSTKNMDALSAPELMAYIVKGTRDPE